MNDFDWNLKEVFFKSGLKSKFSLNFKNVNYETRNVEQYKKDTTAELYGAFGYFSEIDLEKKVNQDLLDETNIFLYEVLMKLGASSKIPQIDMPKNSFEIASMLDIDKRAKKILLKSQSENDRLIVLNRILKKAILKIDYNDSQSIEYSDYNQFEA